MSYPVIPVRWKSDQPRVVTTLELASDHELVGTLCAHCDRPINGGDAVALVAVGPNPDDADDLERHAANRWYSANGVMTHDGDCADAFEPGSLTLPPQT